MRPAQFVVYLTCFFLADTGTTDAKKPSIRIRQDRRFLIAEKGDNLTLQCFCEDVVDARFYWYKLNVGQKPKHISTFYKYDSSGSLHDEFENSLRVTLDTAKGKNHLTITNLLISDSGTYYCATSHLFKFEFAEGTTVIVKSSDHVVQTDVHHSLSETIQPGGSVTLNCTVQSETCDGEHSVYWFRDSEKAHPALIYTHGDRDGQCERNPNHTQSHTCVYNLPITNLNVSHSGTYYCAVASCGHILFGNKTKLDLTSGDDYFWKVALTFTSILCVLLASFICLMNKTNSCESPAESKAGSIRLPTDVKVSTSEEIIFYAALSVNMTNRSRAKRDPTWSECVYYSVKQ